MIKWIEAEAAGVRIDAYIAEMIPELSRSGVQKLLEEGKVKSSGKVLKKNYKTVLGDMIEVEIPDPKEVDILPQEIPLEIAYEDKDVIVINKPKGMVVHPAPGHSDGTLVNALMHHCGDSLSGINGEIRPGIVHRIDKDTSGLIIAAKNDDAHRGLADQLKDHSLYRVYEAIVCGRIREDEGTVNAPIGRHPVDRKRQAVNVKNAREAVTHYRVIARYNGYTHVECRLQTGRTHQIRVHMASIGHPVLGDTVYGRKKPEKGLEGQCLHARRLRFVHPITGENTEVESELPEYFTTALSKLGPQEN